MGDLDTGLIKEFANRPAFYNKTNAFYKDKIYTERAWKDISNKLGYQVVLLKDRMYQLRNRYNLEKRKVENQRQEGIENPQSSWPLFQYLTFLDGHIRPRKSYKRLMRRATMEYEEETNCNTDTPPVEVKIEPTDDNSKNFTDVDGNGYETDDELKIKHVQHANSNATISSSTITENSFVNPAVYLLDSDSGEDNEQNVDIVPSDARSTSVLNYQQNFTGLKRDADDSINNSYYNRYGKIPKISQSTDKFEAFGSFLSVTLSELPEIVALELMGKFTSEVIKALIDKTQQANANAVTTSTSLLTSLSTPSSNSRTSSSSSSLQ